MLGEIWDYYDEYRSSRTYLKLCINLLTGGRGGGVVYLNVSGMLHVEGLVSADGESVSNQRAGGGAGGSIHVQTAILEGSGTFKVS